MRRVIGMAVGLAIFVSIIMAAPDSAPFKPVKVAKADISWCGGFYGMRVYESFNFTGASKLYCGNTVHAVNVTNLGTWTNRISSVRTRNTPFGCCHRMHLYDLTSYGGVFVSVKGNVDIANMQTDGRITSQVPGGFNNRASSMRTRID